VINTTDLCNLILNLHIRTTIIRQVHSAAHLERENHHHSPSRSPRHETRFHAGALRLEGAVVRSASIDLLGCGEGGHLVWYLGAGGAAIGLEPVGDGADLHLHGRSLLDSRPVNLRVESLQLPLKLLDTTRKLVQYPAVLNLLDVLRRGVVLKVAGLLADADGRHQVLLRQSAVLIQATLG